MLTVSNLYKSYNDLQVLKGIDLHIEKGELVSIIGSSGAGKTTLLQILGTLEKPSQGTLEIANQNPFTLNSKELAQFRNQNIGFIFQFHQLLPEFNATENVMLPALIGGMNQTDAKKKAENLLTKLNLFHRLDHQPKALSGGEQQRVAVARALMNEPAIIFADEPSGNLDSKNAEELHQLFFQLREEWNQTFVIVTHNQDLSKMADRSIHIVDGQLV